MKLGASRFEKSAEALLLWGSVAVSIRQKEEPLAKNNLYKNSARKVLHRLMVSDIDFLILNKILFRNKA